VHIASPLALTALCPATCILPKLHKRWRISVYWPPEEATIIGLGYDSETNRTGNVRMNATLRRVRVTIVAAEKQ
jgi:hypothetical protein